jgi:uncharacterized cupredoxin-like copper-binding protein
MQHNLRDRSRDHQHGRIYRVTYTGRPAVTPPTVAGAPVERLLELLKSPDDRLRYRTKIELSARDTTAVMAAVQRWAAALETNDPRYEHHMMEALWVQQWHNRVDQTLLKRMLRSTSPQARAAATRVLCYWRDRVPDTLALLMVQAKDEHPAVRLEAVRAASFFRTPEAVAVAEASRALPSDPFLDHVFGQTMITLKTVGAVTSMPPAGATAPAGGAAPAARPAAAPDVSPAAVRRSLTESGVQVVSIGTLPEQMLYDVRWFAVEAGKPVRVVLTNADAMPHNIVFTRPGAVAEIGTAAMSMPAPTDPNAPAYVPNSPLVLKASRLLQRDQTEQVEFTAPANPGEYNFVCTFPGHWYRMYGVMVVVPNLEAFAANPKPPNDPLIGKPYADQRVAAP